MLNRAILVILQVIDDAGPALPELLSRLRSLHALHEQSVLWVNRLTAVESEQASIADALKSDREALNLLEASLAQNMAQFSANIGVMERRISALL